jgi:hypothetical protein
MIARTKNWRAKADEIRSAPTFSYDRAVELLTEIVRFGGASPLAQDAQQS